MNSIMKLLLLATSLSTASSFVASPSLGLTTALRAAGGKSDANVWDELKQVERDLVVQQQVGELDEAETSKAMAEKLLETALEYVRTKERIEEDRADAAHRTFEHAVEEERVLKEHVVEEDLTKENILADSYVDERLHVAQETEKESLEEEQEHMGKWAELRMEEEAIKSTLKELKELDEQIDPGDRLHLVWDARLNMFAAHKTIEKL